MVGAYCREPEALELTVAVFSLATLEMVPEVLVFDKAFWASTSNVIPDFCGSRELASSGLEIVWSMMLSLIVAAGSGPRVSSAPGKEVICWMTPSSDTTA